MTVDHAPSTPGKRRAPRRRKASGSDVDPDIRDKFGWTPLMHAAQAGGEERVRELLGQGADVGVREEKLWHDALMLATRGGWHGCVEALLSAGADPNAKSVESVTPLMRAVAEGHLDCARSLLAFGARPNSRDWDGHSALRFAAMNGRPECVALLLAGGAQHSSVSSIRSWLRESRPECAQVLDAHCDALALRKSLPAGMAEPAQAKPRL